MIPIANQAAREARRARGQHIGRPKALSTENAALARRVHAAGEPVKTIAETLGVSAATAYRLVAGVELLGVIPAAQGADYLDRLLIHRHLAILTGPMKA